MPAKMYNDRRIAGMYVFMAGALSIAVGLSWLLTTGLGPGAAAMVIGGIVAFAAGAVTIVNAPEKP